MKALCTQKKGWYKPLETKDNTALLYRSLAEDPEFIKACEQALQDPEKKEQIIRILQHAGLIQASDRLPA